MSWWRRLLEELAKPEWTANLFESLVGAGIALTITLVVFRRQLRHDRALASTQLAAQAEASRQQIEADAQAREAGRKSRAAEVLGRELIQAVNEMDQLNYVAELELLEASSNSWESNAPGATRVYRARNEAAIMLDLDESIYDLWRERTWRWEALQQLTKEILSKDRGRRFQQLASSVSDSFLDDNKNRLQQLGIAFCRWDGIDPPPGAQTLGEDWRPLDIRSGTKLKGRASWQKRREELLDDARLELERIRGRYYKELT